MMMYYTQSGRTARAGKSISLSILTNRDMRKFGALEKRLKLKIQKLVSLTKDIASKDYILGQKIF